MSEDSPSPEEAPAPFPLVPALVERLEARRVRRSEGVREAICKRVDAHSEVGIGEEGLLRPDRLILEYAIPGHRPRTAEEELPGMQEAVKHMGHCMPQFFLRNILRHTMDADEPIDSEPRNAEPANITEESLEEARREATKSHRFIANEMEFSGETLRIETDRGRQLLREEDWSRLLGREIRESLPGPIWKYFPEPEDLERYGDEYSDVVELESKDTDEREDSLG